MLAVEEWNKIFEDVLTTPEDQARLISGITRARDEYVSGYGELELAKSERDRLKTENDSLKQANMDLFLRIGKQVEETSKSEDDSTENEKTRAEKITIEDLFKEEK